MSRSNGDEDALIATFDPGGQTKECERFGPGSRTNRYALNVKRLFAFVCFQAFGQSHLQMETNF